ncbi:MAG: methyltransferase [Sphingomonadales bacterium]|nr:methyltransferase [Sphingomonadales bacterium]
MLNTEKLSAAEKSRYIEAAANKIAALIVNCEAISRDTLNQAMRSSFGTTNESGIWTQKDSFEMLELANILALKSINLPSGGDAIDMLLSINLMQPTHTTRSEEQIKLQQFSTPIAVSYLAWKIAQARPDDTVMEPNAGTGLLAAFPKSAGHKLTLNEIDPMRCELLKIAHPKARHLCQDSSSIHAFVEEKYDIILMNPPFAKTNGQPDPNAAIKHLLSAANCLAPNGRIVAIMPESFCNTEQKIAKFSNQCGNATLTAIYDIAEAFKKHGTQIDIKIAVLDEGKTNSAPIRLAGNLQDVLQSSSSLIRKVKPDAKPIKAHRQNLFSAFKPAEPRQKPTLKIPENQFEELPYTISDQKSPPAIIGQYLAYQPSTIDIPSAKPHPSKLVESAAMGSIKSPKPTYKPTLPRKLITEGILSEAQLETIIYAGEATEQYLPGKFITDEDLLRLSESDQGRAYRQGFFLGDGTGAGKGRQIAAIIMDRWLKGDRQHIWISESSALIEDARRDWKALGNIALDIQPLSSWKSGRPIDMKEGILFTTYATIRNSTDAGSRLHQVAQWAGDNFNGALIFDESHALGGAAGSKNEFGAKSASLQGLTGVRLQNALPNARVIYSSATGASEIENIAYASRLGLWGKDTAFSNQAGFISEIKQGGIAAMEIVARELKAQGLYVARSLSFEGVEYDILEHELTDEQIAIFNIYADAWSIIHRNFEKTLQLNNIICAATGATLNSRALSTARSRFESSKQRFFNQTLLAMKMPALILAIEISLEEGRSCVVQLVTTAEAMLGRKLSDMDEQEKADLDVELSPTEYIIDYLKNAFPTTQMRIYVDDEGKERSEPMLDNNGCPIQSAAALEARENLLEQICALPNCSSALDSLINHFGQENVAEVTGRTRRLMFDQTGKQIVQSRSARSNIAEAQAFMDGEKRILAFSDAGGTGRSYHASLNAKNQERREHFLLEPGWRADKAIQGLGRTNRTHQASGPIFRPVTTNCKGERRFISTIARRLDSLGALTKGQRQTGGQNLFNPADNLESQYAKDALVAWINLLTKNKLKSTTLAMFEEQTGLKLIDRETGDIIYPTIQRYLNRILAMKIETQNAIFDEFMSMIEIRVEDARKAGTLDIGLETFKVEEIKVTDCKILRTDPRSKATTELLTLDLKYRKPVTTLAQALRIAKNSRAKLLFNTKSGNPGICIPYHTQMTDEGDVIETYIITRPGGKSLMTKAELAESSWELADLEHLKALWTAKERKLKDIITQEQIFIVTGQLLPIWNHLDQEYSKVQRIIDQTGKSLLGRTVHPAMMRKLCSTFNIEVETNHNAAQIISFAKAGQTIAIRPNESYTHRLTCKIVNKEQRLEVQDYDPLRLSYYKSIGCFTEIISFKTRLFIPGRQAPAIITKLQKD